MADIANITWTPPAAPEPKSLTPTTAPYDGPTTLENIKAWHAQIRRLFATRNAEYRIMRQVFDGQHTSHQSSNALGIGELQDRKLLMYNMINTCVRRYMDEMSAPVEMQAIGKGIDDEDLHQAESRQKLLMDWLESEHATIKIVMAAFYQGLFDKAILQVRPDPKRKFKLALDLIVPEYYLPIPLTGHWFEKKAAILTRVPFRINEEGRSDPDGRHLYADGSGEDLEFWSDEEYVLIERGMEALRIKHAWGRLNLVEVHNIPIPHRQRGQGDGDQSVGLQEYLNQAISDQADVLAYLANPIVVVRGSKMGVGNLLFAPRAVWELERDGSADILSWMGSPPSLETQILRIMQGIEDSTGMSAPAFGREIPSGVSGEAVRSILAGFNTRIGAKQTFMGVALVEICELAQMIWEKEFPNETFEVAGEQGTGDEEAPSTKSPSPIYLKPKEFKGWYKVKAIFQPQNETVRVFTEIEKMKGGVQSRLSTMRRLGVPNPHEEYDRIMIERLQDAKIAQMMQGLVPNPQMGGTLGSDRPIVMGPDGRPMTMPQAKGARQPIRDRNITDLAAELKGANPGNLNDLLGLPNQGKPMPDNVTPADVMDHLDELRQAGALSGNVFLEGKILEEGGTDEGFNLRVDKEEDIPAVREALGPLADRATIRTAKEAPYGEQRLRVAGPRR